MSTIVDFSLDEISLSKKDILRSQGVPDDAPLSDNFLRIYSETVGLFKELAEPRGIIAGLEISEFEKVFKGEGLNEKENPVEEIYRESDYMALFAVTLGPVLSDRVTGLFQSEEYASGYMLDSVSSYAADKLADLAASLMQSNLLDEKSSTGSLQVLSYSPGYCGWHISGQKKLFEYLHPEEIGITLNDSYLMSPIKTVSGVLIRGPGKIHEFENSYPFCDTCTSKTCIERMRNLR